jgi:galactosylceramidase
MIKPKIATLLFVLTCLILVVTTSFKIEKGKSISIDLSKPGRTFEGIGALSAGASTRLLIDYPEPYRSQVLDFLFKPKFGASLQHLKVEIGGDANSTCGTEPSHARTREEFENPKQDYFERGYEWWLMKEAKKRNPDIYLDCLEWGAPGWIGDGKYYSTDNINYIISFIKGAKKYHNLKIDYTGIWNERMYDTEFIKDLRKGLDQNGLEEVKLIAADLCCHKQWQIADDMKKDDELRKAIDVIGDHYPERDNGYNSSDNAKSFGIPVWNNEGGPWKGDWSGFEYLAKMYNRDYIEGKMTKNITWSLITSYYNNLSLPNSGIMTANSPWSGFYDVEPAVWSVAHTTQFTQPGWKYIDSGCGYLDQKGSYVTLVSPSDKPDFSIVAETIDAKEPQTITFKMNKSADTKKIAVWCTIVKGNTFEPQTPISVHHNEFTVTLQPKALYTFTTTAGQQKTTATPAENKPFPFPFNAGFEDEKLKATPKYFMDQGGAFEVAARNDGKGNCLRQVITRRTIEWEDTPVFNQTVAGDTLWTDYSVSCDVLFAEKYSYASLFSRATEMHRSHKLPEAYQLILHSSGKWELMAGAKKLVSGLVILPESGWDTLVLETKKERIKATINGKLVADITDTTYTHGMAGVGSSFNQIDFDNFSIK